jgi:hypothetical protein
MCNNNSTGIIEQEFGSKAGRGARWNFEHAGERPQEQCLLHHHNLDRRQRDLVQVLDLQHPGIFFCFTFFTACF